MRYVVQQMTGANNNGNWRVYDTVAQAPLTKDRPDMELMDALADAANNIEPDDGFYWVAADENWSLARHRDGVWTYFEGEFNALTITRDRVKIEPPEDLQPVKRRYVIRHIDADDYVVTNKNNDEDITYPNSFDIAERVYAALTGEISPGYYWIRHKDDKKWTVKIKARRG